MTKLTSFGMTPDFTPVVKLMAYQSRTVIATSQEMFKLAMLPWQMASGQIAKTEARPAPLSKPEPAVQNSAELKPAAELQTKEKPVSAKPVPEQPKPAQTASKPAAEIADDLTQLKGVGPKLAQALNQAGVTKYAQIAGWSEADIAWADGNVAGARGRAAKNGWVAQAAALMK